MSSYCLFSLQPYNTNCWDLIFCHLSTCFTTEWVTLGDSTQSMTVLFYSVLLKQLQQIVGRILHGGWWWSSWQTACSQHCARRLCVCRQTCLYSLLPGGDPAALWSRSQKFSGLANIVGEITWQTKHNRLTRYTNTHRLSFDKPFLFSDYLLDSRLFPLA